MDLNYDSMVFYRSFYEAIKELPKKDQLKVYEAVCRYGFYGEEPELDGMAKIVFLLIRPQLDANIKRKEVGRKNGAKGAEYGKLGGRPKNDSKNPQKTPTGVIDKNPKGDMEKPSNVNVNVNVNDNVNGNVNIKRFAPPALDEVKAYCSERGNRIDAEAFVDFYSSKGWKVGNQPMKDWKACVRTWERREKPKEQPFIESNLGDDLDLLERASLERRRSG